MEIGQTTTACSQALDLIRQGLIENDLACVDAWPWSNHGEHVPSLDVVVGRFGRRYGLGATIGDQVGGIAGHIIWPQVLTRIATTVVATGA